MTDTFEAIATRMRTLPLSRVLVAIDGVDGVDGSGKSTFAAKLAAHITWRPVLLLHADDFLNPAAIRKMRGPHSAEAQWLDLYDYNAFRTSALNTLHTNGNGRFRTRSYDLTTDRKVDSPELIAPDEALILVEGMFLHRDELVKYWAMSVVLDVPFTETARRMALRDGTHPDPAHESMQRYVGGQRIYFAEAEPWNRATILVDNSDFDEPRVTAIDGIPQA